MSSMSMLSEFKVQEDGLRSFNLKPNLDEIKEEEVWSEDEVWAGEEEVCEEDDDEVWMRVQKSLSLSLSLSESSSHPPPPTTIEFDISKTNEEGWRKVEESLSLSESPLDAPPPPPQIEIGNWKTASIKYKKTTKWRWDGYSHGWTSFGEELEEHRSTPITLVEFKNLLEANDYFDKLKNFKGDRIVECHIISGDEVMIESVDSDIETWVEEEYKSFSSEGGGGMMEWWDHIKARFKTIFRDILRALQFLFERSAYCGNLANRISIINQKTAKICDFRVEGDVEKEIWQDRDELWHLMVTVLLRCCLKKDLNAAECDDILKEGRVPLALRRFLLNLHNRDVQKKWDVLWLLDESFFWEDIEKHRLIRKLNGETVLFLSDDGFRSAMETLLGESNLVSYVTSFLSSTDPQYARRPEFKVLSHGLRLQQAHKRKLEDLGIFGYKPPYENNIFHAVVAYSKNLVFHHKHHSRLHLSTCQLASLADGLFHGGCSMIRNAIAIGMDSSKRTWRDVSHLLSKEDL